MSGRGAGAATAAVVEVESTTALLVQEARVLTVQDREQAQTATEFLGRLAQAKKHAESQRTFLVKPLNDHVKAINEAFKAAVGPLEEADRTVRAALLTWTKEEERRHREAEAAAAAQRAAAEAAVREAEAARITAETEAAWAEGPVGTAAALESVLAARTAAVEAAEALAVPAVVAPPPARVHRGTDGSRANVRRTWKHEVVDPDAVPDHFKVINESAIQAAVRSGVRSIPGVRIFEEETLAVSGR